MTNKDNMMITIMIVKAVIKKKHTCKVSGSYLRFLSATQKIAEDFTGKMSNLFRYKLNFHVFVFILFLLDKNVCMVTDKSFSNREGVYSQKG